MAIDKDLNELLEDSRGEPPLFVEFEDDGQRVIVRIADISAIVQGEGRLEDFGVEYGVKLELISGASIYRSFGSSRDAASKWVDSVRQSMVAVHTYADVKEEAERDAKIDQLFEIIGKVYPRPS